MWICVYIVKWRLQNSASELIQFITPRIEYCDGVSCLRILSIKKKALNKRIKESLCTIGKPSSEQQFHEPNIISYCLV